MPVNVPLSPNEAQVRSMRNEIERLEARLAEKKCVVTGCGMYDAGKLKALRSLLLEARVKLTAPVDVRTRDRFASNLVKRIDAALGKEGGS